MLEVYRPTLAKLHVAIGEALLLEEATFTPSPGGFAAAHTRQPLVQLKKRLLRYIRQAPVVRFNSESYDLNLIKKYAFTRYLPPETEETNNSAS